MLSENKAPALGILTGSLAPTGYLTEVDSNLLLQDRYRLDQHASAKYPPRTCANIKQAGETLVLGLLTVNCWVPPVSPAW